MASRCALFHLLAKPVMQEINKITVVGAGNVGIACAVTILSKGISSNIVIIDTSHEKAAGEVMDLQHGSSHLKDAKLISVSDYAATKDSKVCIITAGVKRKPGDNRLTNVHQNAEIMKSVVPNLVRYSPDTILVVVSNPVDILSYLCWKISKLPVNRVIGTGTSFDSSRFKYFIGKRLGIPSTSVIAWIIGEHGDTSVPVWSGVSVAGTRLIDLNPALGTDADPENWKQIHNDVVRAAYDVIKLKGHTSWGIALCTASIVQSILQDINNVEAVSTCIKGIHGVTEELFLSLPAQIGSNGISNIIVQKLTESEKCAFKYSAAAIYKVQESVKM